METIASLLPPHPRILEVRLDGIGDCVLSTAFFIGLREQFPSAHITAVLRDTVVPLFRSTGLFDEILSADRGGRLIDGTLSPPYDLAVAPRWDFDYWGAPELVLASGAPVRVGFDRGAYRAEDALDAPPPFAWTHIAFSDASRHEADKAHDLLNFIDASATAPTPRLFLSEVARLEAQRFATSCGCAAYVVLGVSAVSPHRIWPVERFPQVIDAVQALSGLPCIVVGGEDAEPAGCWLEAVRPGLVFSAAGQMGLMASAALIAEAQMYIGMDTGLMHLAAVSGVPVVEISCHPKTGADSHFNSPSRFGPYATLSRIVRPDEPRDACNDGCRELGESHCIMRVTASHVTDAVESLLAEMRK